MKTAGKAAGLRLTADRATIRADDPDDLSYVRVDVVDADGNICPEHDVDVAFSIDAMRLAAIGNADPTDTTPSYSTSIKTFRGSALAVVQSTSDRAAVLVASAQGFPDASLALKAE